MKKIVDMKVYCNLKGKILTADFKPIFIFLGNWKNQDFTHCTCMFLVNDPQLKYSKEYFVQIYMFASFVLVTLDL